MATRCSGVIVPALVAAFAFGCGGGGTSSGTRATGGTTGGTSGATLTVGVAPSVQGAKFAVKSGAQNAPVNLVTFAASGADILVRSVILKASGTADDAKDILGVKLFVDDGDGHFNATKDLPIGGIARYG